MQGPLEKALIECKRGFIAVAGFSPAINLLMLAVPIYMLQLFDRVLSSSSTETLILLTVIVIVALAVFALPEAIRGHVMTELGTWLDRQLGPPILSGSVTLNLRGPGEPSVQGLRDLGTFRTFLAGPGMFPILDAPWMPIFVAIIFVLHPLLGWVALGGALVLFGLAVTNDLASRKPLAKASGLSIRALNQAESVVRNADAIEAMGMMPNLIKRWREKNSEMLELQGLASVRSGRISALSKFCRMVLQVSMLGTGAWLALEGELSPGAMIGGSILMARALAPVEQGLITAQFNPGILYSRIDGKLKSQTKSTEWYVPSAEAGHATARYHLAQRFENGRGDRARLRRGAALGDPRVGDGQRTA
jgi:ABC-type protease/lipase transport system fused ATPase/permease subunit